jgi:hypothetical protein
LLKPFFQEQPPDPSQPGHDDQIDQLTQTVNTLTTQLTTVLSGTQNTNFLVSPLQETALPPPKGEHHLSTIIQPVRFNGYKEPTGLHLLTLVAQQTAVDAGEQQHETAREARVEIQEEEQQTIIYPVGSQVFLRRKSSN